jgi:pyruvate/2-oxoacid:ferredoxin oxidoreductase alpha subunit
VAEALSKFKAVGVVETNQSFGIARYGGILTPEVCASLYNGNASNPLLVSFMAGLGGEMITLKEFDEMAEVLVEAAQAGRIKKPAHWIGFEE